jgi:arylsulfatase A-like enzyme
VRPPASGKRLRSWLALLLLGVVSTAANGARADESDRPPNVIIILTDDQGYADVGVYGAKGFDTPHLDTLAAGGMRFTQFYVAESTCSPSRAALLTGSYPMRIGLPSILEPRSTTGLNPDEVTLAELLKQQDFATAAIGKWHLGDHPLFLPTNHGFDSYFGLPYSNDYSPDPKNNHRKAAREYPMLPLLRDTTIIEREPDQATLTRRYTEEAVAFIEAHRDQPFFLYLAHSFPHVPLYVSNSFKGSSERGLYGDVIQEIDWSVGRVMETLERLDLDTRTLVFFTSDNGPWLAYGDHGGSAGPLREGKFTTFEGGHRVPAIARWPGRIPAGSVSDELVTAMDLLPTIARLVGAEVPTDRVIDGRDIWPIVSGQPGARSPHERFLYYYSGQLQAVRSGKWKLHVPHPYVTLTAGGAGSGGALGRSKGARIAMALFDLESDVGETTNVIDEHPEVLRALMSFIMQGRAELGDRLTRRSGSGTREPGRVARPWKAQLSRPH